MNKKDIIALVEDRLPAEKKQEVIKWLLKNPKQQQRYHILKAKHVAKLLRKSGDDRTQKPRTIQTMLDMQQVLPFCSLWRMC